MKKNGKNILIVQILLILADAYFIAIKSSSGDWLFSFYFTFLSFIIFPIIGIMGLITSISIFKEKARNYVAFPLIIISVFMIPVLPATYLAKGLSFWFSSVAKLQIKHSTSRKKDIYMQTKEFHYNFLSKEFEKEKEILDVKFSYVLLDGNFRVNLQALSMSKSELADIDIFVKKLLVGKRGKIILPDYATFERGYIMSLDAFPGMSRNKMPRDPKFNKYFAPVKADIIIDGKSVTEQINEEKKRRQSLRNKRYQDNL